MALEDGVYLGDVFFLLIKGMALVLFVCITDGWGVVARGVEVAMQSRAEHEQSRAKPASRTKVGKKQAKK